MVLAKTEYVKSTEIKDVVVKKLRLISDERGRLMEILRNDEVFFEKFGQVYMSTTYPGIVKGFHLHKKQIDNICCVHGMIKLVLFDVRADSETNNLLELFIGTHNPCLVIVPNNILHGWKCISEYEALIINVPTEVYDYKNPDEERVDPHDEEEQAAELGFSVPYNWNQIDR